MSSYEGCQPNRGEREKDGTHLLPGELQQLGLDGNKPRDNPRVDPRLIDPSLTLVDDVQTRRVGPTLDKVPTERRLILPQSPCKSADKVLAALGDVGDASELREESGLAREEVNAEVKGRDGVGEDEGTVRLVRGAEEWESVVSWCLSSNFPEPGSVVF